MIKIVKSLPGYGYSLSNSFPLIDQIVLSTFKGQNEHTKLEQIYEFVNVLF